MHQNLNFRVQWERDRYLNGSKCEFHHLHRFARWHATWMESVFSVERMTIYRQEMIGKLPTLLLFWKCLKYFSSMYITKVVLRPTDWTPYYNMLVSVPLYTDSHFLNIVFTALICLYLLDPRNVCIVSIDVC